MTPRGWLRMHIPRLRVHYSVIPREASPIEVPGRILRAAPDPIPPEEGPDGAFRREVLEALRRIETRVERLCGCLERDRDSLSPRHHGEVLNIGGGGLAFTAAEPLAPGDLLDLCVLSPWGDPRPVFAVGEVRWVREEAGASGETATVAGAAFTDIAGEDRDAILRTVFEADGLRARSRLPGPPGGSSRDHSSS